MEIHNKLQEETFHYSERAGNITDRNEELLELYDISEYCKKIKENIAYDMQNLFMQEVLEGVSLMDWLYQPGIAASEDERQLLSRMIEQMWKDAAEEPKEPIIKCSLGACEDAAENMETYIEKRRGILENIDNASEYAEVMPTCFLNSVFADDISDEMRKIKDFELHTKELTENLSVLNDCALEIYHRSNGDANIAMRELASRLLACAPDYNHQQQLRYEFSYEIEEKGKTIQRKKQIICHPHLKLIREDSDFRIYFMWKDKDVGRNEIVLVGRIGRHGW